MLTMIHQVSKGSALDSTCLDALEYVIDGTDPKIRLVNGYKRRLCQAIVRSLNYAEQLVDQIPQAPEISSKKYVSNQYTNAFFASTSDLKTAINHSSELVDFFTESKHNDAEGCYALLCMQKHEKTVFGMEQHGEQIRKDVQQTAVSFFDQQMSSPALTEPEARENLKCCFFDGLITNALSNITALRATRRRLKTRQQMLQARLRSKHSASEVSDSSGDQRDIEKFKVELTEIEKQLDLLGLASPEASLEQVEAVFLHPESFVKVERTTLKLDKMGIKISADASRPGNELELAEVELGNATRRIVVLAGISRDDVNKIRSTWDFSSVSSHL